MVVNKGYTQAMSDEGKVHYILNCHVERGRSYSVWLGLQNIPAGMPCFIQNIDNPFAEMSMLLRMISNLNPEGYTVPQFEGKGGHPVLLGSRVADHLRKMEEPGNLREVLRDFSRTEIQAPDGRILWNINTPEDYLNFITFTNPPGR
jgi:CTP:molybdopterin cytidylyltransferase MocA